MYDCRYFRPGRQEQKRSIHRAEYSSLGSEMFSDGALSLVTLYEAASCEAASQADEQPERIGIEPGTSDTVSCNLSDDAM